MFAGPRVETTLFMRATGCREVEMLQHACKSAVNVRLRNCRLTNELQRFCLLRTPE